MILPSREILTSCNQSGKNHTNDIIGHFIEDLQSNKPLAFFSHKTLYLDSALILVAAT